MVQTKFIVTLLLSFGFLLLYWMTKRKEQAFRQAPSITAEVIDCFVLDPTKNKVDLSVDRGEILGNFVKIKYRLEGREKHYESYHINKLYQHGEIVEIKYIDENTIILVDEGYGDKKMAASFILGFGLLFIAGLIGIILDLSH